MNEYFQAGAVPAPNSPGSSAVMRQEFNNIAGAFDKLPILGGHAGEIVIVDPTGTALVTTGSSIGDYVTKDGTFTLTNKTIAWANNTFPGFGTGATKNAGKMANQVLLLENNMQLPAIDGSLLTGLNAGMVSGVVQILQGGTGADNLTGAQHNLGIDLKAPIHNPVFTGAPSAPTPPTGDTSSRLATTFFVTNTINAIGAVTAGSDLPLMDGVASAGNLSLFAASRQDHVHPSDTSRAPASAATAAGTSFAPAGSIAATNVQTALQELDTEKAPLASPTFTGVPQAPTVVDPSDTTDKIATTAWVQTRLVQIPVGVQLSDSNAQNLGTNPAPGVGVEASRWDHVHALPIASQIPNVPNGNITGTNVQWALNELDALKSNNGHTHVAADVTNLTAALVPFVPVSSVTSTNVQAAMAEIIGETVPRVSGGTGAAAMPTGTTAQRPSAIEGYFRRNSEIGQWEGYTGSEWVAVGQGNAASTPFTPAGNIAATNVQAAIQELDTEKVPYTYLAAAAIPFTPAGNIAASNVQAAIQELDAETQAGLATKLSLSGGTMTGQLYANSGSAAIVMKRPSAAVANCIIGQDSDSTSNWYLGNITATNTVAMQAIKGNLQLTTTSGAIEFVTGGAGGISAFVAQTLNVKSNVPSDNIEGPGINCVTGQNTGTVEFRGVHIQGSYFGGRIRPGGTSNYMEFKSDGNCTTWGAWLPASDGRVKKDREVIGDALAKVAQLTGYTYRRADITDYDGNPTTVRSGGLIAQDVESVLPEAVVRSGKVADEFKTAEDNGDFRHVSYDAVTALLVQAVKELKAEVDDLRAQLVFRP